MTSSVKSGSVSPRRHGLTKVRAYPALRQKLSLLTCLGGLLALVYVLRSSLLTILYPRAAAMAGPAVYAVLLGCAVVLVVGAERYLFAGLVMLALCLPGAWCANVHKVALLKYGGWAALVVVAGPVLLGPGPKKFRDAVWATTMGLLLAVGFASLGWFALGRENLGRGYFTGVMNHCMILAPMTGIAIVFALSKALARESWRWSIPMVACIPPFLLAGSRSAVGCLLLGVSIVFAVHRKWQGVMVLAVVLFAGYIVLNRQGTDTEGGLMIRLTETMREKGLVNTREHLWRARWAEFNAHPFFGIGIGIAEGDGAELDDAGNVMVEPGSSYLALLSMTGISGALGFLGCLAWSAKNWFSGRGSVPKEKVAQMMGIGGFLALHAVAEGWILAVGSPLAFIFWLWLGHLADQIRHEKGDNVRQNSPAGPAGSSQDRPNWRSQRKLGDRRS